MKWVKASERLPGNGEVMWRGDGIGCEFYDGIFYRPDGKTSERHHLIEWLDESTPEGVTADPKDEEIARLKEGLDAAREDEAIRFAEWASINYYSAYIGRDSKTIWSKNGHYTTEQLYQLYKKQTP